MASLDLKDAYKCNYTERWLNCPEKGANGVHGILFESAKQRKEIEKTTKPVKGKYNSIRKVSISVQIK